MHVIYPEFVRDEFGNTAWNSIYMAEKILAPHRLQCNTQGGYEMHLFEIVLICRVATTRVKLSMYSFLLGLGSDRSSDPFMMWIPPVNSYSIGDTYLSVFNDADGGDFRNYYSIVMYSPEHQADIMVVCKTISHC